MLKVPQNLKGNLRVERRTKDKKKKKPRSSYQTSCNEVAEKQVLKFLDLLNLY